MPEQLLPEIPLTAMDNSEQQYTALVALRERIESLFGVILGITTLADSNIKELLDAAGVSVTDVVELQEVTALINTELDAIDVLLAALLGNAAIADITNTAATVSASYVQAELQLVADDTEVVSDKLDTLLATLRSAGVLNV